MTAVMGVFAHDRPCAVCNRLSVVSCPCEERFFCSRKCQVIDWEDGQHHTNCNYNEKYAKTNQLNSPTWQTTNISAAQASQLNNIGQQSRTKGYDCRNYTVDGDTTEASRYLRKNPVERALLCDPMAISRALKERFASCSQQSDNEADIGLEKANTKVRRSIDNNHPDAKIWPRDRVQDGRTSFCKEENGYLQRNNAPSRNHTTMSTSPYTESTSPRAQQQHHLSQLNSAPTLDLMYKNSDYAQGLERARAVSRSRVRVYEGAGEANGKADVEPQMAVYTPVADRHVVHQSDSFTKDVSNPTNRRKGGFVKGSTLMSGSSTYTSPSCERNAGVMDRTTHAHTLSDSVAPSSPLHNTVSRSPRYPERIVRSPTKSSYASEGMNTFKYMQDEEHIPSGYLQHSDAYGRGGEIVDNASPLPEEEKYTSSSTRHTQPYIHQASQTYTHAHPESYAHTQPGSSPYTQSQSKVYSHPPTYVNSWPTYFSENLFVSNDANTHENTLNPNQISNSRHSQPYKYTEPQRYLSVKSQPSSYNKAHTYVANTTSSHEDMTYPDSKRRRRTTCEDASWTRMNDGTIACDVSQCNRRFSTDSTYEQHVRDDHEFPRAGERDNSQYIQQINTLAKTHSQTQQQAQSQPHSQSQSEPQAQSQPLQEAQSHSTRNHPYTNSTQSYNTETLNNAAREAVLDVFTESVTAEPEVVRKIARTKDKKAFSLKQDKKAYACTLVGCGMRFTRANELNKHVNTHTGDKLFACTWENCEKRCFGQASLDYHMKTHTGEKPFPCIYPDCKKRFAQPYNLNKHLKVHTGEKPHACTWEGCKKSFANASNLSRHIKTHSGIKPYQCTFEGCGKRFTQLHSCNYHMKSSHDYKP
eukprot:CFRG7515T1